MRQFSPLALLTFCSVVLSACFASDKALIDDTTSVTPLKPGIYVATETEPGKDDKPTRLRVSVESGKTIFTSLEKGDSDEPSKVLLRKVRDDFYAMLEVKSDDKSFVYNLVQIDGSVMSMYGFTDACKTLEGIAAAKKVDVATYGVTRVEKDNDADTCYFKRFEDLAAAYKAVLDAGPPKVVTIVKPAP